MGARAIVGAAVVVMALAACGSGDEAGRGGPGGGGTGGAGGNGGSGGTGGSGGIQAPQCSVEVDPCGGDLVGTWTLEARCGEMYTLLDAAGATPCRHLEVVITWDRWEATTTYEADGTYHGTYDVERRFTMAVPAACLEALDPDDLDGACAGTADTGLGRVLDDGGCSRDAAGACACVYRDAGAGAESGDWSVDGGLLEQDPFVVAMPYCVSGDTYLRSAFDAGTGAALGWVYRRSGD